MRSDSVNSTVVYNITQLTDIVDRMRSQLRLAVIHGGDKTQPGAVIYPTHNPRSTKTYHTVAKDIAEALGELGFKQVSLLADDMTLPQTLETQGIHLAWLNTGGVQGYDPVCHTPAMLEMLGVPYIGHNPLNSSILDNKHAFKRELQALGIATAPFVVSHPFQDPFNPETDGQFQRVFADYSGPFVVKPVSGRASVNVFVVDDWRDLGEAVATIHRITANTALIEAYLPGREFCISVCGRITYRQGAFEHIPKPFAFSAIERILEADERIFTSMDAKGMTANRMRLLSSQDESERELRSQLEAIAQQIYRAFNLSSLVRIDLRRDSQGQLYVLEANPKPDLKRPTPSQTSLVAQGLQDCKMTYTDLILSLLGDRLYHLLNYQPNLIPHLQRMMLP
ncbi:MAG: D-alanyl-alanine synthetase [Phormidium sp.]|nr:MAG: D-alanine-D-alanine ligase [Phormidium sp. OSCR]